MHCFHARAKKRNQPAGQNMALQERFPGSPASQQLTISRQTLSAQGGIVTRAGSSRSLRDEPSPAGREASEEPLHYRPNITCLLLSPPWHVQLSQESDVHVVLNWQRTWELQGPGLLLTPALQNSPRGNTRDCFMINGTLGSVQSKNPERK